MKLPIEKNDYPRISLVTPSYNQGQFLEETIQSVLTQGYPNLEYIIIDGGSTDHSVAIIRQYAAQLAYWVSAPDRGQAHAINTGFARCTGAILGWINSDDTLLPGSLDMIANAYQQAPKAIIVGDAWNRDEEGGYQWLGRQHGVRYAALHEPWRHTMYWCQPGTFFPRALYQRVGALDEQFRYIFDWEWMLRALQVAPVHYIGQPVACFRYHQQSKTVGETGRWIAEKRQVYDRDWRGLTGQERRRLEAGFNLYVAETCLRAYYWERRRGFQALRQAVQQDWRVLGWPAFWRLLLKACLPLSIVQHLRQPYLRYLKSQV